MPKLAFFILKASAVLFVYEVRRDFLIFFLNMTNIIIFVKSDTLTIRQKSLMIYFAERARFHALISHTKRCLCYWNT